MQVSLHPKFLPQYEMRSDYPDQPTRCESGEPPAIGLAQEHDGERRSEHDVVWFSQKVNNGIHTFNLSRTTARLPLREAECPHSNLHLNYNGKSAGRHNDQIQLPNNFSKLAARCCMHERTKKVQEDVTDGCHPNFNFQITLRRAGGGIVGG